MVTSTRQFARRPDHLDFMPDYRDLDAPDTTNRRAPVSSLGRSAMTSAARRPSLTRARRSRSAPDEAVRSNRSPDGKQRKIISRPSRSASWTAARSPPGPPGTLDGDLPARLYLPRCGRRHPRDDPHHHPRAAPTAPRHRHPSTPALAGLRRCAARITIYNCRISASRVAAQ
jgi:hypothetical protein